MTKKLLRTFLTIIIFHVGFTSFSQRIITGRVIDMVSKTALKDVTINVKDKNLSTTTNHLGFFQISVDSLDILTVSLNDYEMLTFSPPNTNSFQIAIKKKPIEIYQEGMNLFYEFLGQNLNYPQSARASNRKGYVYVTFQIDSLGELKNLNIVKDIGSGCGKEVLRVLKKVSKKFIPDKSNSIYILPVQFSIGIDNSEYPKLEDTNFGKVLPELVVRAMGI